MCDEQVGFNFESILGVGNGLGWFAPLDVFERELDPRRNMLRADLQLAGELLQAGVGFASQQVRSVQVMYFGRVRVSSDQRLESGLCLGWVSRSYVPHHPPNLEDKRLSLDSYFVRKQWNAEGREARRQHQIWIVDAKPGQLLEPNERTFELAGTGE